MAAGRSGRRWKRLVAEVKARRTPACCRCGQPLDYAIPYRDPETGAVNTDYVSVDHYPHPLTTHPHLAEDPANLAPAHLDCNTSAQDRNVELALGAASEDW